MLIISTKLDQLHIPTIHFKVLYDSLSTTTPGSRIIRLPGLHAHVTLRACSIELIRIRRTPPFSDEAFDWAQLNPDESSELIHLIRKTTDEFG